jgi:long-chain acyl-CoA synthetase
MPRPTLQTLFDSLPRYGDRPAVGVRLDHGIRWVSYRRLHRDAVRAAAAFRQRGLRPGARVLFWSANSPEWVAFLLASALRGLVVVPVDALTPPAQVADLAARTEAELLLFGHDQEHRSIGMPKLSMSALDWAPEPPVGGPGVDDLRMLVRPDDPAAVLFTAGTTGAARGVVLTHANLMAQADRFLGWRRLLRVVPARLLALSPLSHVQGLVLGCCLPLGLGLSVMYTRSAAPGHLIRAIRGGRVAVLATVPRVLEVLEHALRHDRPDGGRPLEPWVTGRRSRLTRRIGLLVGVRAALGPRFSVVLVGGATLPASREQFWRDAGCAVVQGYGSTETAGIVTINDPLRGVAGSIGRPLHPGSVRLADDGEILVRGPHLSPGYVGPGAPPLDLTPDGHLRTGDLGRIGPGGGIVFLGRKKDLIVTAEGNNVAPTVVEAALAECPGHLGAVVAGLSPDGLEQLHAFLLLQPGADLAAIVRAANARLPPHQRVRSWSAWPDPDFPRGMLGKIDRDAVARRAAGPIGSTGPTRSEPATVDDCLADPDPHRRREGLAAYLRWRLGVQSVAQVATFAEQLGLDSMEAVRLMSRVEQLGLPGATAARALPPGVAAAGKPQPPERRAPGWQFWPGVQLLRRVVRGLTVNPAVRLWTRVEVAGLSALGGVRSPVVFALDRSDRFRPSDYMLVYRALPRRLTRRLVLVMGVPPTLESYLCSPSGAPLWYRVYVRLMFQLGLPLAFPFALVPSTTPRGTQRGIDRTCGWIDRGYHPLLTWGPGGAVVAVETQASVVPVRLSGNVRAAGSGRGNRPTVRVTFGRPIRPPAGIEPSSFDGQVRAGLREADHHAG